jgi:peptide/nickel transport system permease protein
VLWRLTIKVLLIAMLGGLATATLVRTAPGYGLGEEQLDPRRGEASLRRAESTRAGAGGIFAYYGRFLLNYARGDMGDSPMFHRPVQALIAERALPTAKALAVGLAGGWILALGIGVPGGLPSRWMVKWPARAGAVVLQSTPAAVLGLLLLLAGARGAEACAWAVALVLYPRLVEYVMHLVRSASAMPHVATARAKGLEERRILARHVLPVVLPELLALAGVSVSMALSAAIPLEMILDVAGIGQLAWQAALGRDMNLLVNLTVLISIAITFANGLAGWIAERARGREADAA